MVDLSPLSQHSVNKCFFSTVETAYGVRMLHALGQYMTSLGRCAITTESEAGIIRQTSGQFSAVPCTHAVKDLASDQW